MKKKSVWKEYIICILFAYVTLLGMQIDIGILQSDRSSIVQFFDSLPELSMYDLAAVGSFCATYAFLRSFFAEKAMKPCKNMFAVIPAMLFSLFMIVGKAFASEGSLFCIVSNPLQILKALLAVLGYFLFFVYVLAWIYVLVGMYHITSERYIINCKSRLITKYLAFFVNRPFTMTFITLFIIYIPYILISYPAIHFGDTCNQIAQGYNFSEGTSEYLNLIDENVRLNGHHPIIHTLFIHLCMVIGKGIFHSYNVGIFLVAFIQFLCVLATISYAVSLMVQKNVKLNIIFGVILYFALSPRIQNYMFFITKDILSACAFLLFSIGILKTQEEIYYKKDFLLLTLSGIAVCFLRNDGKYIVLLSMVLMIFFCHKNRKKNCISIVLILLSVILLHDVIMPAFHITPSSKREALSVPFQQTARYLRDYGDDVTEEEMEVIAHTLKCNNLAERYNPMNADFVKECYNESLTDEELKSYFKVWFAMFQRHPEVYVEAFLGNYYNYFYPGEDLATCATYERSAMFMTHVNDALEKIGMDIHYPEWSQLFRQMYETLREKVWEMPVLSLLLSPAAYVWLLIAWFFYLLQAKDFKRILPTVPMLLSLCVAFVGPRNGEHYRYLYAITVSLPIIITLSLEKWNRKTNE